MHAGHMFFFGYSNAKPHVQYKVADERGAITHSVGFNLREPIMMHDFAVTQDYAIFLDVPLFFRAQVQICHSSCCRSHPAGQYTALLPSVSQELEAYML